MPDIAVALEAELSPARLDGLARDFMRDLVQAGMRPSPVEMQAGPGERGVVTSVGKFVIDALLSGQSAAALLDVVKTYVARERSLRISIAKPDGTKVEIDARNINSSTVAAFLGAASPSTG